MYFLETISVPQVNNVNNVLGIDVVQQPNLINVVKHDQQMHLWHNRLGHPSSDVLKHVNPSFKNKDGSTCDSCEVCARSKQSRLPFPLSKTITTEPLELLHLDVWGPY